eukprot:358152-Chlamydomonas_euryale.AAC.13
MASIPGKGRVAHVRGATMVRGQQLKCDPATYVIKPDRHSLTSCLPCVSIAAIAVLTPSHTYRTHSGVTPAVRVQFTHLPFAFSSNACHWADLHTEILRLLFKLFEALQEGRQTRIPGQVCLGVGRGGSGGSHMWEGKVSMVLHQGWK